LCCVVRMASPKQLNNFEYCCPTRMVFGEDAMDKLPRLVPETSRVMLVYGGGSIKRNGVYDSVRRLVGDRIVHEFGGIEANPDFDTCMKAVDALRANKADFILAVGGGSVIDASKFITLAAGWTKTSDAHDIMTRWGAGQPEDTWEPHAFCPIGVVLTLPATGSEMNNSAVISCRRLHEKSSVDHDSTLPAFAVVDPRVTFSLPRRQVMNGLADAFVHVMEQYAGHFDMGRVQDEQAEGVLRALIDMAPDALAEPPTYKARADMCWAATQALNLLMACGIRQCWATHRIGHMITAYYGLDHAVTLAIVMPRLLKHLLPLRTPKLARMAERVWHIPREGKDDATLAVECIDRCEAWFQTLGIATTFSGNHCDGSHIDEIAATFTGRKIGAEKTIGPEEVKLILQQSL